MRPRARRARPGFAGPARARYHDDMTKLAEEAARLVDSLPQDKARSLIEYARFLSEKADEEAWEQQLGDPRYAPGLATAVAEVDREIRSGQGEPLDPDRL